VIADGGQAGAATSAPTSRLVGPGWAFALLVFVVWRTAHVAVIRAFGGSTEYATFQWDAGYYLEIAQRGYVLTDQSFRSPQTAAFYPALPALAAPLVRLLGDVAGPVLLANVLGLTSFIAVEAVARQWFGDVVARRSLIMLACWPASFFLWCFYTEGLLVTATAGALWADRSGHHRAAAAGVYIGALTRSSGFAFGPVLVAIRCWRQRRIDRVAVGYALAWAVSVATLLAVQGIQTGDPLAFTRAQLAWGRTFSAPWTPLVGGVRRIVDTLPVLHQATTIDLATTALFLALGVIALARALQDRDDRWFAAGTWTLTATAVPLFGTIIIGIVRFVISAWTALITLAVLTGTRPVLRWLCWLAGGALSVHLLYRVAIGAFVA
jgi:hypothetical protein